MTHLRVGARGSDLSLAQTRWTIARLIEANPGLTVEIVIIKTHGDRDQSTPLAVLDITGGFVKDIEVALLRGDIDLAVHSLKDVPTVPTPGLTIAAVPERAPAHDVLITRVPLHFGRFPPGFVVGTSSPRRTSQIKRFDQRAATSAIRGNVPTRIRLMDEGRYDAIVLAAAGLERLGIRHPNTIALPLEHFLPAPGQGALALQAREGSEGATIARSIDHGTTRAAVSAERAFLQAAGGGCHAALAALARVDGPTLVLRGEMFVGARAYANETDGPTDAAEALGQRLAHSLRATVAPR